MTLRSWTLTGGCFVRATCLRPSVAGPDTLAAPDRARYRAHRSPGSICRWSFGPPLGPKGRFRGDVLGCNFGDLPRIRRREDEEWGHVNETQKASVAAHLEGSLLLKRGRADVFRQRERTRRRKVVRLLAIVAAFDAYLFYRLATDNPIQLPSLGGDWWFYLPIFLHGRPARLMVIMPDALGPLAAPDDPPGAGRGGADRDQRSRHPGRRGPADARRVPGLRDVPRGARRHPAARHPLRGTARDRQDVSREGDGQAGRRAVPVHVGVGDAVDVVRHERASGSVPSSRLCGRRRARKGARSASSRRSTRSAGRATASACRPPPAT